MNDEVKIYLGVVLGILKVLLISLIVGVCYVKYCPHRHCNNFRNACCVTPKRKRKAKSDKLESDNLSHDSDPATVSNYGDTVVVMSRDTK